MTKDEKYMFRCLQLAANGRCTTPPNPMVGAVIVYQDRIIGEGYHVHCGQAHAEVNAIQSVKDQSLLKDATIYVSLEPCSHYGKTPPCADLIIEKNIPRVVIGCMDPFALVAGKGIQKLRDAGVQVKVGVLEKECQDLNRRFMTFHLYKRPYITLKWAESSDGFIDVIRTSGRAVKISSDLTQMVAHKRRAEHTAILVGRRTALLDDPSLSTREWYGQNPVRLVIGKDLTLPSDLRIFNGEAPTIVFTAKDNNPKYLNTTFIKLDFNKDILPQIMQVLYEKQLQSLLVEGGQILLQSLINAGLWDEAYVERGTIALNEGVPAPSISCSYEKENCMGRLFLHYSNPTYKFLK